MRAWRVAHWLVAASLASICQSAAWAQATTDVATRPPAEPVLVDVPIAAPAPAPPVNEADALRNCDGYGNMSSYGDGMTKPDSSGFWRVASDRMRRVPPLRNGVANCTSALNRIDTQFPQYWQRRVSVLQSRALHRLAAKDFAGALADLDAADAAGASADIFYQRSLGMNTKFIRAMTLTQKGDRAAGEALAMATWSQRPYAREVIAAALTAMGPGSSRANIDRLLEAAAEVDPSRSGAVFLNRFETGRFADALALADEVTTPVAVRKQTYDLRTSLQQAEQDRARNELFALEVGGRKAYALAALGRDAEARQMLADASARIDAATPALAPLPETASKSERTLQVVREQVNLEIKSDAPAIRKRWTTLVEARLAAAAGRKEEARSALRRLTPKDIATYAAMDIALITDPPKAADRKLQVDAEALFSSAGLPAHEPSVLFDFLLDPEWLERTKSNIGWADRMFMSRDKAERGNCKEETEGDLQTVCYWGRDTTPAVTEERALLRAAHLAQASGASHLLIEKRRDIRHTIVATMYGTPISVTQDGYESRLTVRFLKADATCWRCIDVAAVIANNAPYYRGAGSAQP